MVHEDYTTDPAVTAPAEPAKKLEMSVSVNPSTGEVRLATNQDPVVMSVRDLTGLLNQFVQNMRPKQARRIILPGE